MNEHQQEQQEIEQFFKNIFNAKKTTVLPRSNRQKFKIQKVIEIEMHDKRKFHMAFLENKK